MTACNEQCDSPGCGRMCSEPEPHAIHAVDDCDCGVGWQILDAEEMDAFIEAIPNVALRDQAAAAWRDGQKEFTDGE